MSRPSTVRSTLYPPSLSLPHVPNSHSANQSALHLSSRTLTLWIHDPDLPASYSRHDAVLNYDLFPPGVAKPGDLAEVRLLKPHSSHINVQTDGGYSSGGGVASEGQLTATAPNFGGDKMERRDSYGTSAADGGGEEKVGSRPRSSHGEDKKFLFVIRPLGDSERKPNLQISLASHVATLFGFHSRATVLVTIVDKPAHEASHLEIYFRDQYITRADMWRLSTALLSNTCPYNSQKLLFINSIKATIGNIWVRGEKVQSAYFSSRTVPIFRSESARYVIFIQMSREMWHFDTDDGGDGDGGPSDDRTGGGSGGVGGEIVFNKLINGFLPELFKRWRRMNAHHLVSIILFTRIVYEHGEPVGVLGGSTSEADEFMGTPGGIEIGEGRRYRDFFRVVVSSMGSADWTVILHRLKKEFAVFLKEVLVQPMPEEEPNPPDTTPPVNSTPVSAGTSIISRPGTPVVRPLDFLRPQTSQSRPQSSSTNSHPSPRIRPAKTAEPPRQKTIITGRPSAAIHGNILEAINLATIQFSRDNIDRDLCRTGISVVMITPGTGHFEVDYETLKATTEGLIANGMGVDLVCLSKVPLHTVPLFRYRNPIVASSVRRDSEDAARAVWGTSPQKVHGSGTPLPEPGDWVYAVPHWIEISFWSTAAEKKTRRLRGTDSKIIKKKDPKGKKLAHGFRARCKMYEVQMMGLVEEEISRISIPFLHENPFYRPLPEPYDPQAPMNPVEGDISGKETEKKRREAWKEQFKWMDDYDNSVFNPLPVLQESLRRAENRKATGQQLEDDKEINSRLAGDRLVLGTSYRSERSHRSGFLASKPKEHQEFPKEHRLERPKVRRPDVPREDTISEREPLDNSVQTSPAPPPATTSTTTGLLSRPGRLARQISFGFKNWGAAPKTTAKIESSDEFEAAISKLAQPQTSDVQVTRGFNPGDAMASLKGLSSPTTPHPSSKQIFDKPSSRQSSLHSSRPIQITHTSKTAGLGAVEATAKERERRRSLVGSPLDRSGREHDTKTASFSRPTGVRNDIVNAAEKTATIPNTVSPTSALAPWVQVLNPSNPRNDRPSQVNQYRRWHHIFPKPARVGTMKWKSLCSPAALPITTEHFPTAEQLANEYQENPYVIAQNEESREELVRAMISLRLSQGYQFVVGAPVVEATGGRGGDAGVYDGDFMVRAGASCFMSRGAQIHQLICDEEYNVEVKRYVRKPTTAITSVKPKLGLDGSEDYISYIKTIMSQKYLPVKASFEQNTTEYNWNYADQYIGGYEDTLTEQLRYWRARFVLIPNDPPESARRGPGGSGTELNDEEIRLEGIRRLTMIFQRNRYVPPEERTDRRRGKKEPNPLKIQYKTVDSSIAVAQELENVAVQDAEGQLRRSQLLTTEQYDTKNLDLQSIANELQSPRGIRLQDRRWHLKVHSNCFIGEDMVSWIIENFKDVETREQSEKVGRDLYSQGLFHHVDKRHEFRDGNFFYRISEIYLHPNRPSSKGGWFGTFKSDKSVPPTPLSDTSASPMLRSRSRSSTVLTDDSYSSSSGNSAKTPTNHNPAPPSTTSTPLKPKKKVEVCLSKCMKYDVDPSKKSYRPEIINLHYDLLHNPDNCYHLRIDWINTTSKLIEDQLTSWAKTVDRFGLKLVEAPVDEVASIPKTNLFRAPYTIKLACSPPPLPPPPVQTNTHFNWVENMENSTILSPMSTPAPPVGSSLVPQDAFYYHRLLLRHFNFVLDTEAAANFPAHVRTTYSWGAPSYKHSQYIHRSGVVFAQIIAAQDILLMANRSYTIRVAPPPSKTGGIFPGPAVAVGAGERGRAGVVGFDTPEGIKSEMEALCCDEVRLKRFWSDCEGRASVGSSSGGFVGREREGSGRESLGRWESPVMAPIGAGSPMVAMSEVHVGGRTVSVGGRSGSGEEDLEGLRLGR